MHDSVMGFVKRVLEDVDTTHLSTLEIGSLNVNGSVRPLFSGEYIGIDLLPGDGVDMVMQSNMIEHVWGRERFDIVVSTECLEHDPDPKETMRQIRRVLTPGGIAIVTARGNCFAEHNNPDYWRFMEDGFRLLLEQVGEIREFEEDETGSGWFGVARKGTE